MAINATFWVGVSFILFFAVLIYLKVPQKVNEILNNLSINPIHLENILELFSRKPELIEINKHINHNEGFNKSLEEDKEFIKKQKR